MSIKRGSRERELCCSFCGKPQSEAKKLVAGPGVCICDECVELCISILDKKVKEESGSMTPPRPKTSLSGNKILPKPHEIKKYLDEYVIGQERAKLALSVAVYNHYKRIFFGGEDNDVELKKSNILLLGPTGVGKTLLAQTLAKFLDVPFAIADATTLTEAGYVGEDVENLVRYLLQNADGDVEQAKRGIIYVDEIDKIASKTDNVSITRDVGGEGVQQTLLKLIEGTICRIPPKGGRKHPDQEYIEVDTSNILFICGGAFVDLDKIVKSRSGKSVIGFGSEDSSTPQHSNSSTSLRDVRPEDLIKFGLIPEFTGRLPVVTVMDELKEEDLVRILTEPKNSLVKQYTKLLAMDGVELEFKPDALRALAKKAVERKTGARGLRAEMEKLMLDVMYEAPGNVKLSKVVVTAKMVEDRCR